MTKLPQAQEPFRFFARLSLTMATGLKARDAGELLDGIKSVPDSVIYTHTHRFLQQHQYLSPEPPNDFAYWVTDALGEDELGEKLASIDTMQFSNIRTLREKIIMVIEEYMEGNPLSKLKFSRKNEEFYFMKTVSFVFPTPYTAGDLNEFAEVLRKITVDSLYYHVFEARLRLEKKTNDFSRWMEDFLDDKVLAVKIARLDPYTHTLEDLRKALIAMVKARLES